MGMSLKIQANKYGIYGNVPYKIKQTSTVSIGVSLIIHANKSAVPTGVSLIIQANKYGTYVWERPL
jgi:hypothetical protein